MVHRPDEPTLGDFQKRVTESLIRLAHSCDYSQGWSGDFGSGDWRKTVAGIAVEVVARGVEVKDVGVGSQWWLGEFRGRFRVLVVAQPRAPQHRDIRQSETTVGMILHLNSYRSRGCCRVFLARQGRRAIPLESSHVEQS